MAEVVRRIAFFMIAGSGLAMVATRDKEPDAKQMGIIIGVLVVGALRFMAAGPGNWTWD